MVISTIEAAEVKLSLETIDCLIRLKNDSSSNAGLYNKIEELQSKIVDNISKNLHMS